MRSNQYGTLIVLYPKESLAVYLDSGSDVTSKDYTKIKAVLNDALSAYAEKEEGIIKRKNTWRGKNIFGHKLVFPCIKQAPSTKMEAWYLIHHMREYIKDQQRLQFPSALDRWCKNLAEASDAVIRKEFGCNQQMIAAIICNDVLDKSGVFFNGFAVPSNTEIQNRLTAQGDPRPFTIDGVLPFPPMPKPSKK